MNRLDYENYGKYWNELVVAAEKFIQYCHPHQTIIIDKNGIELLSGELAKGFIVND